MEPPEAAATTQADDESRAHLSLQDALSLVWVHPARVPIVTPLTGQTVRFGRSAENTFPINDVSVSRTHLELRRHGPVFIFKDLGSSNGTILNGVRIDHSALAPGDVLRIGNCVAVVCKGMDGSKDQAFDALALGLLGSQSLARSLRPARSAATSTLPMLILGETGTGKERVARAIHQWSGRSGPFCAINCAALPENLAEAELFGYRRGAFTGSSQASSGLFRAADHGTLLLDEVGDLPLTIQAKLLRVLEQREVLPLGETVPVRIDVRILAAGQGSLSERLEQGSFRADLMARLAGMTIELPPLRERREDVLPLFRAFLEDLTPHPPALKATVAEALCLYGWPRNVRELRMLAEYLAAVYGGETELRVAHLPPTFPVVERGEGRAGACFADRNAQDLWRLAGALRESGGNLKAAAELLGISRARAYRLLAGRKIEEVVNEGGPLPQHVAQDSDRPDGSRQP